jgi:hypothetical protein
MDKLYVGQSKLRIAIDTGTDLTGASLLQIQYRKGSGTASSLTGASDDYESGVVYWESTSTSIFLSAGSYPFWVKITYSDGKILYSEPITLRVYNVGE